jgi:hypothetical protein
MRSSAGQRLVTCASTRSCSDRLGSRHRKLVLHISKALRSLDLLGEVRDLLLHLVIDSTVLGRHGAVLMFCAYRETSLQLPTQLLSWYKVPSVP